MDESVFIRDDGGRFLATELARGPWDRNALHGGAPAALLMRAFEQLEPLRDLLIARVTYEFLRPVPLGELDLRAEVVRPGRRFRVLEASLHAAGTEVVRARAAQVAHSDQTAAASDAGSVPAMPDETHSHRYQPPHRPTFGSDAHEIRFAPGDGAGDGAVIAWFRLSQPLVAGEEPSPMQRMAAAADFGNGIGTGLSWEDYLFLNVDLTVYFEREPAGEWIGLEASTTIQPHGVAICQSALYDECGHVGSATQALLVSRR
jgi:acyl-coenzyme A thioesterase PaaI-like protein